MLPRQRELALQRGDVARLREDGVRRDEVHHAGEAGGAPAQVQPVGVAHEVARVRAARVVARAAPSGAALGVGRRRLSRSRLRLRLRLSLQERAAGALPPVRVRVRVRARVVVVVDVVVVVVVA